MAKNKRKSMFISGFKKSLTPNRKRPQSRTQDSKDPASEPLTNLLKK